MAELLYMSLVLHSFPASFLLSPSKGKDQAFANNGPTQYADATYREVTNLF